MWTERERERVISEGHYDGDSQQPADDDDDDGDVTHSSRMT